MNKVMIMGRLTKDPEIRMAGQTQVVSFTLAVNRKFVKQGEERQSDFIMCKAFSKTAEFISKYFTKGQQVVICGRIQTGSYDKDGGKVYTTDVIVEDTYFADSKKDGGQANTQAYTSVDDGTDDLPF